VQPKAVPKDSTDINIKENTGIVTFTGNLYALVEARKK
jgi:hypothetical protein